MKVIIDGIEYVPVNEKKEYKVGDLITYKGFEWYVMDYEGKNIKLLLKDVLNEEHIKKYVDDEWWYNGCYVRMNSDIKPPFDYEKSYMKNVILENFRKDLGIKQEVRLLTKDEVDSLSDEMRKCNDDYWTMTPYDSSNAAYAFSVYYGGRVRYGNASSTYYGARAVVVLPVKEVLP